MCAREVALNRRLASQAYLGVAQLIGPDGGAAEPVIVMRRYDDADRLSTRVIRGDDAEGELVRIAAMLARFRRTRNVPKRSTPAGTYLPSQPAGSRT